MSTVVYANVHSFSEIAAANWVAGDNSSYAGTQFRAACDDSIALVGRQDKIGNVSILYAANRGGLWERVTGWHLALAKFFDGKMDSCPTETLKPWLDIDDAALANAVRQIVALDVGTEADEEQVKSAIRRINQTLRALGLPAGDWTYCPMLAVMQTAQAQ